MGKALLRRTRMAALAAFTATATGLAAAPTAALASPGATPLAGGGCLTTTSNGWNVGVCSASVGSTVYGDLYVNSRGSLGSSCYVKYRLLETTTGTWVADSGNQSCYLGHHPNISAPKRTNQRYRNYGYVYVNGTNVFASVSPDVF